jgi:hypothetical protein
MSTSIAKDDHLLNMTDTTIMEKNHQQKRNKQSRKYNQQCDELPLWAGALICWVNMSWHPGFPHRRHWRPCHELW